MNRAMYAAASGMAAQQQQLEIVADNLANTDVAGFKANAATFADVRAGALGLGVAAVGRHVVFAQGKIERSGGPFDVAIDGPGFFAVEKDGASAYTRNGEFARGADGRLHNAQGWTLRDVRIPADALTVRVERDGHVFADMPGVKNRAIGRIRIATFPSPEGLRALGATVFAQTRASGAPHLIAPRADRGPALHFGALERSSVTIVEAMMQILAAQRAYEANAKGVQAADELQRIANNLHRG